MNQNLNFFKGKTVFVTGDTGFKGAWLCFWLKVLGAEVTGYALPPKSKESLFSKLNLKDRVHHIDGDIRDYPSLHKALKQSQAEFVFHLAAQALVRRSYEEPQETFSTNILGSVNLLEAVRQEGFVKSLVYITSDKCYLNKEWLWGYRENDELGGPDPYSASKASAELVFRSYYQSYFKGRRDFGCGTTRAGNVIGGGDQSSDRIVPDIIKALTEGQTIKLRNPKATRPWQHVLDPLYGYLTLALRLYHDPQMINGESWNFGPAGNSIKTVEELSQGVIHHWGKGKIEYDINPTSSHEAGLLHLSIDKARQLLKWEPICHFNEAIKKTTEWYKRVFNGEDPQSITQIQIDEFVSKVEHATHD